MKAYYSRRARRECAALALGAGLVFLALAVAALLTPDAGWTVAAVFSSRCALYAGTASHGTAAAGRGF